MTYGRKRIRLGESKSLIGRLIDGLGVRRKDYPFAGPETLNLSKPWWHALKNLDNAFISSVVSILWTTEFNYVIKSIW